MSNSAVDEHPHNVSLWEKVFLHCCYYTVWPLRKQALILALFVGFGWKDSLRSACAELNERSGVGNSLQTFYEVSQECKGVLIKADSH